MSEVKTTNLIQPKIVICIAKPKVQDNIDLELNYNILRFYRHFWLCFVARKPFYLFRFLTERGVSSKETVVLCGEWKQIFGLLALT